MKTLSIYNFIGRRNIVLSMLVLSLAVVAGLLMAPEASAISTKYYDDASANCDIENCGTTRIDLEVGEMQSVQQSSVNVTAYFTANSGQITIPGANYCPGQTGNADILFPTNYFGTRPIADGTNVTRIDVTSGASYTNTQYGRKFAGSDSRCNDPIIVDVNNLEYDPNVELYYASISVNHINLQIGSCVDGNNFSCDGIQNYFSIRQTGANNFSIAHKGGGTGYEVTAQQIVPSGAKNNVTYSIKFGSDCSVPAGGRVAQMSYYDLDNVIAPFQPQQNRLVQMQLKDEAGNVLDTWTPASAQNTTETRSFNFMPGTRYVWEIQGVYTDNTIQFGTPFDGIYYQRPCNAVATSCGTMSTTPASPTPGQPVSVASTVTYSGGGPSPSITNAAYSVTGPGYSASPSATAVPGGSGTVNMTSGNFSVPNPGVYTVNWSVNVGGIAQSCSDTFRVLFRPYFEVNHGDVSAGASFATASQPCATAPKNGRAGIVSWNTNTAPGYSGAGVQYAAFAMNYIQSFTTNQDNGQTTNGEPYGLSFANENYTVAGVGSLNPGAGLFGGMFGDAPCTDYWSDRPVFAPAAGAAPDFAGGSLDGLASNTYAHTGNVTINASTIPNGRKLKIYIDGDVVINGNITYQSTSWTNRIDIPSVELIVRGSIFINRGVSELTGTYVAIPNAGADAINGTFGAPINGTIATCSDGFQTINPNSVATGTDLASLCSQQLTITGSMIAHRLWMLRTAGSYESGQPAEIFNYSPEVWLSPAAQDFDGAYQSIIGLPPVL